MQLLKLLIYLYIVRSYKTSNSHLSGGENMCIKRSRSFYLIEITFVVVEKTDLMMSV